MYCRIPIVANGTRGAPEANKIKGMAVTMPDNINKIVFEDLAWPKAAIPFISITIRKITAGMKIAPVSTAKPCTEGRGAIFLNNP